MLQIGQSLPHDSAREHVRGEAAYIDDLPALQENFGQKLREAAEFPRACKAPNRLLRRSLEMIAKSILSPDAAQQYSGGF